MRTDLADFLITTTERELPNLRSLSEEQAAAARGGRDWTRKQELGHLIDSASNNHQRFVRTALDGAYSGPGYAQNGWVAIHGYQDRPWTSLVEFWWQYNALLGAVVGRIEPKRLEAECIVNGAKLTLGFVIEDYVFHMQHHIDQILDRPVITPYPGAGLP